MGRCSGCGREIERGGAVVRCGRAYHPKCVALTLTPRIVARAILTAPRPPAYLAPRIFGAVVPVGER